MLLLFFHHRYCWALGVPEITREHWRQMIEEYKDGTRTVEDLRAKLHESRRLAGYGG